MFDHSIEFDLPMNSMKPRFAQSEFTRFTRASRSLCVLWRTAYCVLRALGIFTRVSSRGCVVQRVIKTFPDKFAQRFPAHNGLGDVPVQIAAEHSSRPSRCVSPRMRYEIRGNVLMYERAARRRSMVDKCAVGSEGFVKCRSRSWTKREDSCSRVG